MIAIIVLLVKNSPVKSIAVGLLVLFLAVKSGYAQQDSAATVRFIDSLNRQADLAVVNKNAVLMNRLFAHDFYFLHSTGLIDSKKTWLKSALSAGTGYLSRTHDSVVVELHPGLAVVSGILTVTPKPANNKAPYRLRYIRIFAVRKPGWQLVSHHSTAEIRL